MDKIICRTCGKDGFADYKGLALHIITNKKTHKQGLRWAGNYLSKSAMLDRKLSMKQQDGRIPMTDEQKEARYDSRRPLSGETKNVVTICPKCKAWQRQSLEVEHTDNPQAWRIGKAFVVLCGGCK